MHNSTSYPIRARLITFGILLLSLLPSGHNAAGTRLHRLSNAAHIERGKQATERYEAYGRRLAKYYATLAATVKEDAPELLAYLQPRGPVLHGYQVLPPILLNASQGESPPTSIGYSWPWTDQLIGRGLEEIARSEEMLRQTKINPRNKEILKRLALDYPRLSSRRANIDAHIQYNHLWQAAIVADRMGYDQATILYDQILEHEKIADRLHRLSAASERSAIAYKASLRLTETGINLVSRAESLTRQIDAALSPVNTPDFVHVENHGGAWVIRVPLFTDIEDREFVHTVKQIIENTWQSIGRRAKYRVQLDVTFISPESLYPNGDKPMSGQKLNVNRHVAQFPSGGAILTTGGHTTFVLDRAIILGPHDVAPRVLAHEFGHILGFRDRYVRGYKDLGEDGFQVMELVADPEDIMAATPYGAVFPRHFESLINHRAANPQVTPASKLESMPKLDRKPKLS